MKKSLLVLSAFLITSCTVHKDALPIGGSKADGTIRMGYTFGQTYGAFEVPKIDPVKTTELAAKKCQTWGYAGAEAFGGEVRNCMIPSFGGCAQTNVYIEFQCINPKEPNK
ncbi:TPA: hypothetical protein R5S02_004354 [Salmonella enterica]|nr:hypothetical protein [Salmonella enterica]